LLRQIHNNRIFKNYRISRLFLGSNDSVSLFFAAAYRQGTNNVQEDSQGQSQGTEVRINQDNYKNELLVLTGLFTQLKNQLDNIQYIDLRFKDPVIKLKGTK